VVEPIALVRDVLDKQIYDINKLRVGKVDGVVLQQRQGRPPRVLAIESDLPTAWRRVSTRAGGWLDRLQRWIAPDIAGPTRILIEHVVKTGIDVSVDIDAKKTNAFVWEDWLRKAVVERIPGGTGHGEKGE
jgi:hypothetical protein